MVYKEDNHSVILQQGVEIWNQWRISDPDTIPQLSNDNLSQLNLSNINFSKCDLTNFYFKHTNLSGANLSNTILIKADFTYSNLTNTNFSNANLSYANFTNAELNGTNFNNAHLSHIQLYFAKLDGAKFCGANFIETDFRGLELSGLDFSNANLSDLNLTGTKFIWANLSGANLVRTKALGTNFTASTFTGACIEDWHTNSFTKLDDVICDYVYLQQGQQERRPLSGKFVPGEFTKIFQKSLETLDLIFRNGVNWGAFAYSFNKLVLENQGTQLDVQSIEKKDDGVLLVRVKVPLDANKKKIHGDFMQGYEFAQKALEVQFKARIEDKDKEINRLFYLLNQANDNPKKISNYYQQNPQFAGGIVDANTIHVQQIGGGIYNTDNQEHPN
jgi:uncharacterized protein YjbI with pentapeptide repeats